MCKRKMSLVCLALTGLFVASAWGAGLAPNDGSIAGNLSLWLRMPDINYDPDTSVWTDLSGNGNDALADVPDFVGPVLSSGENAAVFSHEFSAVHYDPTVQDLLKATNLNGGAGLTGLTVFSVQKVVVPGNGDQRAVGFGSYNDGGRADHFNLSFDMTVRKDNGRIDGKNQDLPLDVFVIYAARMEPAAINMWLNSTGTLDLAYTATGSSYTTSNDQFYVGDMRYPANGDFDIAEVVVYNTALSDEEIEGISEWLQANVGAAKSGASGNTPAHEATDVLRDTVLTWNPVASAATRDLYFGTVFDDVNDADRADPLGVLVSQAQSTTDYDPGRLAFGQTYYWRVDEVNGAPDNTIFSGDVWSFTVEPFAIPVTKITATASSAHDVDMVPEKTIDGSGMDALDQHSSEPKDMWLSGMADPAPSIQYEFDKAYKLHELWVWNSNQLIEGFVGLGVKDVSIEVSMDGTDWTVLTDQAQFAQAPGKAGYAHNTTIDLGGTLAQFVRLNILAGYGMLPQNGLSEVRFFYIPTNAREPQPSDGAVTDTVDVVLSWRAGREAASHEVYLGTDSADLALVQTVTDNSVAVGPLDFATTYFWQVVEVNDAEDLSSYAGEIWSFSTPAYGVVDNFDQYDDDCNRIFFAWVDGLGHNGGEDVDNCNVAPYNGNGTGSIVGNANSPFAEQTIVYAGRQSMPLEYDSGVSETTLALDAQDWTAGGIQSLSLQFYGAPGNTGQLYVKINNSKVSYAGLPDALQKAGWTPWNIDLSAIGANLSNVTSLTLGIENASALGMIYVDEIRLYPQAPEFITPADPDPANLVAQYSFDGNANDSVSGLNGSLVGSADFAPGQQGQALSLNTLTVTDYVEITGYQGILGASAITVAAWVNTSSDATGAIIGWGPNVGAQRFGFRIDAGRLRFEHHGGNVQGDTVMNDGSWHHVAVTIQADSTVSYPEVQLWLDGQDNTRASTDPDAFALAADLDVSIGRRPASDDRYFIGQIDELYIYDRALSQAEIAGLAGLTQPFDKPFAD
jgi:hypothetical protein